MKYTISLALMGSLLVGIGKVVAAPAPDDTPAYLNAGGFKPLSFDIDEDIKNPVCGVAKTRGIHVKNYQTEGESEQCLLLKSHIDKKGLDDWELGDFIVACADGQYTDPWLSGTKRTKFVFTPDAGAKVDMTKSGVQKLPGKLVVDNPKQGTWASPHVDIGIKVDPKKNEQIYQFIYCP